jgi:hypothetical protein
VSTEGMIDIRQSPSAISEPTVSIHQVNPRKELAQKFSERQLGNVW